MKLAIVTTAAMAALAMGSGEKVRDPALDPARATFEKSVVARVETQRH